MCFRNYKKYVYNISAKKEKYEDDERYIIIFEWSKSIFDSKEGKRTWFFKHVDNVICGLVMCNIGSSFALVVNYATSGTFK